MVELFHGSPFSGVCKTQNRLIRLILRVLLYLSQNIWLNLVEPTIT